MTYRRAWQGQGVRGVASQKILRPGSAALGSGQSFTLQDHISPSEDLPFLPPRILMRAKETESDNVRAPCGLCWSSVSGKPSGVTISLRLEKPHPPRGIATSFSSTFNDHTLWDHGWQWPQETRRGGLIKWGIRHCWLPTRWPSSSPHAFLSGCGQPPSAEADNPGTHFPSLLCI